jgi:hypothetical protein
VLRAEAKAGNAEPVDYEWTLDRGKVVRTTDGRFVVPDDLRGEHQIEVAAIDTRGLRSKATAWTLTIESPGAPSRSIPTDEQRPESAPALAARRTEPPATVAPEPRRAEPRPASSPPPASPLVTEAEVRDWLGRVERAYEARNSRAIVDLGAVKSSQLPVLEAQIRQYRSLDVDIADAQITLEGQHAVVSFKRTDRDETGRVLDLPRQKFRLERGPSGLTGERID